MLPGTGPYPVRKGELRCTARRCPRRLSSDSLDVELDDGVGLHLGVGVGVLELMVVVAQRLDAGHRVAALEHGDAVEVVQLVLQAAAEEIVASISHSSPSRSK